MEGKILTLNLDMLCEIGVQLINTFILFFCVAKLLYKPAVKMLKNREERIKNDIDSAKKSREEAEAYKKEYEDKLSGIKKESDRILDETHKKATDNEMQILKEAHEESDALKRKTQNDIEKYKEQVKDDLRKEIVDVATVMARKIVAESLSNERKQELLDESLNEMENLKWLV
ncbi:MAG: F0F1 ATP synthase subunit B [Clostridia bacterium]|nr:F0F1 ATP synthase subunit B [Clostridia bacterium]